MIRDFTQTSEAEGHSCHPRKPAIWFEVENLLRYFDHFANPTGIQRVSLQILAAAHQEYGTAGRIQLCRMSLYTGRLHQIGFDEIFAACAKAHELDTPWSVVPLLGSRGRRRKILAAIACFPRYVVRTAMSWVRDVIQLRDKSFERQLVAGDTIVCLGGSWLTSGYSYRIAALRKRRDVRFVQLVHDVIPIFNPEWTPMFGTAFSRWLNEIAQAADLFLVVSSSARQDLLTVAASRNLKVPPVEIIHYGATFESGKSTSPGKSKNSLLQLPGRYILCVSTLELRKNHRLLLRVWRRLLELHPPSAVPELVLVGRAGYFILDSRSFLRELAACRYLDGKIILMSDLCDEDLAEVYRRTLFTVFPSLYEGWGLPVAESLAHGKFCVASRRGAIPEVGGDLVDYFDPADEQDVFERIERPIFDPTYLSEREAQIRIRYRLRSWSGCLQEIVAKIDDMGTSSVRAGGASES